MRTRLRRLAGLAMLLLAALHGGLAAAELAAAGTILRSDGRQLVVERDGRPLLRLDAILFNYETALEWQVSETADRIVLHGRFPAAVDFYREAGDDAPREVEIVVSAEADRGFRLQAAPAWGRQVTLEFAYLGDHFFGLTEALQPDNRLSPDLTGAVIDVDIASEGAAWRENYASASSAFFMSTAGYGAFFDTFARGRYAFAINGRNRIHHDSGSLDFRILPGADGRAIHRAYFDVIGAPKALPPWGLGPVGWRDQNESAAEILDDVRRMSELEIPFTAWFVDRPYSDGAHAWSEMNFAAAFANAEAWIAKLEDDYGLRFMTWASPATFGDTRFAAHLPGALSYIDLSHPAAVSAYQAALARQYAAGVRGHKIDRADEYFPVLEAWHDATVPIPERRSRYTWLMAKIHHEALHKAWGDDHLMFQRSAWHRTQAYLSAIWAGDPRTSWEGLQANFANGARAAFLGFPVWGSDVGGYQGEGYIPADLYLRWLQAGMMSGFFEIKLDGAGGEGADRMPWRYDDTFLRRFRAVCAERMALLPYLYSLSRTAAATGTLMQPLAYRHFDDARTYAAWDSFYVGDILVAPVFTPGTSREVYLPAGRWRDYDDATAVFEGGRTVTVEAPLDKLPRFVRDNSLVVTGNVYRGSDRRWAREEPGFVVRAWPGADGMGTAFVYVDLLDANREKVIGLARDGEVVRLDLPALTHAAVLEIVLDDSPVTVRGDGRDLAFAYRAAQRLLSVPVPAGHGIAVEVALRPAATPSQPQ